MKKSDNKVRTMERDIALIKEKKANPEPEPAKEEEKPEENQASSGVEKEEKKEKTEEEKREELEKAFANQNLGKIIQLEREARREKITLSEKREELEEEMAKLNAIINDSENSKNLEDRSFRKKRQKAFKKRREFEKIKILLCKKEKKVSRHLQTITDLKDKLMDLSK